MDLDDLRMIDEGLTQIKVRLVVGTRTIIIPIDGDLLKNTEEVVSSPGPLCFDSEGVTLREINDSTLTKNIAKLALRVSIIVVRSFLFTLTHSWVLTLVFSLICRYPFWRLKAPEWRRGEKTFM